MYTGKHAECDSAYRLKRNEYGRVGVQYYNFILC